MNLSDILCDIKRTDNRHFLSLLSISVASHVDSQERRAQLQRAIESRMEQLNAKEAA